MFRKDTTLELLPKTKRKEQVINRGNGKRRERRRRKDITYFETIQREISYMRRRKK